MKNVTQYVSCIVSVHPGYHGSGATVRPSRSAGSSVAGCAASILGQSQILFVIKPLHDVVPVFLRHVGLVSVVHVWHAITRSDGVHFSSRLAHCFDCRRGNRLNQSLKRNRKHAGLAECRAGMFMRGVFAFSASSSLRPAPALQFNRSAKEFAGWPCRDHGLAFVRQRHRALLAIGPVPQRRSEGLQICLRDIPPTPESLCA